MAKKILGIVGSYRENGTIDAAVSAALEGAREKGAEIEKIFLPRQHIEFCRNCRICAQQQGQPRGKCVIKDDMEGILQKIDSADGLILGSPVNFGTVTAVMKRFVERLIVYGYWPWGKVPRNRVKTPAKKAVIITSSAAPGALSKVLMRNAPSTLRLAAKVTGAKVIKTLYFGMVAKTQDWKLEDRRIEQCRRAGRMLVR